MLNGWIEFIVPKTHTLNIKHNTEMSEVNGKDSIFRSLRRHERERDGFHKDNSLNGYFHIQMFSNYCK